MKNNFPEFLFHVKKVSDFHVKKESFRSAFTSTHSHTHTPKIFSIPACMCISISFRKIYCKHLYVLTCPFCFFYYGSKKWFIVLNGSLFYFSLGTITIHYQSHSQRTHTCFSFLSSLSPPWLRHDVYTYREAIKTTTTTIWRKWKNHYFRNGLDETSCGKFDKKPFLIRFRNRKYPFFQTFLFVCF